MKSVADNGHTLQVDVGTGSTLKVGGDVFELLQLHVHSPSEHRLEGENFLLEAHFVNWNSRGELAVAARGETGENGCRNRSRDQAG
jgi:carbonic anhydrase